MSRAERRRMERETKAGGGPPKSPEKTLVASMVIAEAFALVDKAGRPRGGMMVAPDGMASLALHDKTGEVRAGLHVTDDGAVQFHMTDDGGRERISLRMEKDIPVVLLADKEGVARVRLSLTEAGAPQILLRDSSGKTRLSLVVDGEDKPGSNHYPFVTLYDKNGEKQAGLTPSSE